MMHGQGSARHRLEKGEQREREVEQEREDDDESVQEQDDADNGCACAEPVRQFAVLFELALRDDLVNVVFLRGVQVRVVRKLEGVLREGEFVGFGELVVLTDGARGHTGQVEVADDAGGG